MQDAIIAAALQAGNDAIVDDTNLHGGSHRRFVKIARETFSEVVCHDFTDVPIETCIQRDKHREASVGEDVIRSMHDRYINNRN